MNSLTHNLRDWSAITLAVTTILSAGWAFMYSRISVENSTIQYAYQLAVHQDAVEINKQFEKFQNAPDDIRQSDKNALAVRCKRIVLLQQKPVLHPTPDDAYWVVQDAKEHCKEFTKL